MAPGLHTRPRLVPKLIAIASSTGGPNALIEIIPTFPKDFPVPIVIVQHMPPIFTRHLAERLAGCSHVKVIESAGNEVLKPGTVYVAPGNRHLELARDLEGIKTVLNDAPPENSCRPAADVLFRSVARIYGPNALCVVLTGMGSDGLLGAREIARAGGRVIAQSGPTCVVWGMPKAVEQAGLCEAVVPLSELGVAIAQRVLGVAAIARAQTGG
jgi:two-component system chemotaxis response regulator CheB